MTEEISGADIDALPPRAAAAAIALGAAGQDPAIANDAALYLRKQVELADLQIADMRREDHLRHWSVVVRHTSDLLRLALELAVAAILVGFVAAVASAVWMAAHDDSLVIEPFSVPPQMEQSGLTGQAIAAQLQDKLAAMQRETDSARPAKSYADNWDDGIKVLIPDTGIAVGDLYRTLARWLGHQTHITGEVYRTKSGIAVTTRSNGAGGSTATGAEADFDSLLQQSAEAIYRYTQPYRYGVYLSSIGKHEKAKAIYRMLIEKGGREDKLWAHMGISSKDEYTYPLRAPGENRKALAIDPDFALAYQNISAEQSDLGRPEEALSAAGSGAAVLEKYPAQMSAQARAISLSAQEAFVAFVTGDYLEALRRYRVAAGLPDYASLAEASPMNAADTLSLLHARSAARDAWANIPVPGNSAPLTLRYFRSRIESDAADGDWLAVLADDAAAETAFGRIALKAPQIRPATVMALTRQIWSFAALAKAETGDFAGAHALVDKAPLDCYRCLRMRGKVRAQEHKPGAAAYWFKRAVNLAPSIPFAYADWGQMLMHMGDLDGAIAKFETAHQKGPHFADPLEMWGEALMQKSRSDLALEKFSEANKYAPNWGRLHLKWGEALLWSGDKGAAKKQFAIAAHLDLTQAEKAALVAQTKNSG